MEQFHVHVRYIGYSVLILLFVSQSGQASDEAYLVQSRSLNIPRHSIVTLDRQRRDVPVAAHPDQPVVAVNQPVTNTTSTANVTTSAAVTEKIAAAGNSTTATVSVTKTPLLGVNGSGILKVDPAEHTTKVSDPISPDDAFIPNVYETPERIKAEHNLSNIINDNHLYYNSSFIGNVTYFNEYWANITKEPATVHSKLSNSHRRATTVDLNFPFPYYGHAITNVTVASGGFVYTGDHTHNWLAATQYIAPLMANFDTSRTNDSYVKLSNSDDKFTAFWENVTLQGEEDKKFVFAVTLYKNGDIVFAYKDIPIDVLLINDTQHPVKVGISDAYIDEDFGFHVKSKKIYEYHRVSLKNHVITNNTILRLTALPTCLQYNTCDSCINHQTSFDCSWCPDMPTYKCSSGVDRLKRDWILRHCDQRKIENVKQCPAESAAEPGSQDSDTNVYKTNNDDKDTPPIKTDEKGTEGAKGVEGAAAANTSTVRESQTRPVEQHSAIGSAVTAFVVVTLICSAAAWTLYAFKNPHTRSGQLLIKYRPSQWRWRRGEARYTAATIHM